MPRYDFRCTSCQWTFEVPLPFGSNECPACPQCGKRATEKLISPPIGIHFHGSGFYKTDSRSQKGTEEGKGSPAPEKGISESLKKETEKSKVSERSKETMKPQEGAAAPAKPPAEKPA